MSMNGSNVVFGPPRLMDLVLLIYSSVALVDPVANYSNPSSSKSFDFIALKLLVVPSIYVCVNLVLENELFGL